MTTPENLRRVDSARVGRLATAGSDCRPHLVPVCFVLDGDVLYSAVDTKPKSTRALRRLANVERNPKVSLLVDHYEEDWRKLWWVRLDGEGSVLRSGPEFDRALKLLTAKYPQYQESPPPGPVLAVLIERSSSWSAS